MEVLKLLGFNSTFFLQLPISLLTLISLTFVFRGFLAAYEARVARTKGSEDKAQELLIEAEKLEQEFGIQAAKINSEIQTLFVQARKEAYVAQEEVLKKAREDANVFQTRFEQAVKNETDAAAPLRQQQAPEIAKQIVSKLLGREASA